MLRRVDLELGCAAGHGVGVRPLAEDVQEAEDEEQPEERQQEPPDVRAPLAADEVAVPRERELVGHGGHRRGFAAARACPTGVA